MAAISARTANWRLFGGGGLIAGGVLWVLHVVLVQVGILALGPWLFVIALIVVAVALAFVAFGETGSNGAVGRNRLGKAALLVYAAGFLLLAVNAATDLGSIVMALAALALTVGGLAAAYLVWRKGVAKGAARWFLFAPAAVGVVWALGIALVIALQLWWIGLAVAVLLTATGVLYLLNSRRIG